MKKSLLPFTKGRFNLQIKLPLTTFSLLLFSFALVTLLSVVISRSTLTNTLKQNLATEALLQADGIRSYLVWTQNMAIDLSTVAKEITDEETSKNTIANMLTPNRQVFGSTIAFEPYAFKSDLKYWAPYYSRSKSGSLQFAQLGTPEYNYFQQDWYKIAKDSNSIILSPPYFDAGGGEIWMVTWSVPFQDNAGKLKGVATADIAFSQTQDIVRKIAVGKQGYAFLVDQNGVVLGIGDQGGKYNTMEDSVLISNSSKQADAWNKMVKDMVKGNAGFVNSTDPQGKAMFVAYEPIGMGTGWSLGLAYPQSELFQSATQLQNTLIFFSILILAVASVILFFLSRSITSPLQKMTSWAKSLTQSGMQLGAGRSVEPLGIHTNDEIEDLADAFNQMSNELISTLSTLEQRVADRTQDLATVAEVGTATATILETDKLLQAVVDLTKERFNLYHSHIYLLDEAGENLVLASGAGEVGRQMVAEKRSIPLDREQSLVARAARERKGVTVNDVTQAADFLRNPLLPDTRSELAVPMIVGGNVVGVFDIQSDQVGRFTESDISVQTTLASQITTSVQNARLYTQAENSKQEAQSLVDYASEAILVFDMETGLFSEPNDSAVSLFGMPREELVKFGLAQLSPPRQPDGRDSTEKAMELIGKALQGQPQVFDWTHLNAQGQGIFCELRLVKMPGAHPRLRATITDISGRKRTEELLRQRAGQQEALNLIAQKIQNSITIDGALQTATRELGHVLGMKQTFVTLDPADLAGESKSND